MRSQHVQCRTKNSIDELHFCDFTIVIVQPVTLLSMLWFGISLRLRNVNITILLDKKFIHVDQCYKSTFLTTKFGWDHTDLSLLKQKVMDTPDDINDFWTSKPAAWKLVSVTPIDLLTILLSGFHYHIRAFPDRLFYPGV